MPAPKPTIYPQLNPIQFVEENKVLALKYNYPNTYDAWYLLQLRYWQITYPYFQPIQQADRIFLQFKTNALAGVYIEVLDQNGNRVIAPAPAGTSVAVAGDTFTDGTGTYALTTYQFNFTISSLGLADGIYFFRIKSVWDLTDDTKNKLLISEPLSIRTFHKNTRLLQAFNDVNEDNMNWEQLFPRPAIRVECDITGLNPSSANVVFEDQNYEVKRLFSKAYPLYKFEVGVIHPIPNYMLKKINTYLSCKYVKLDDEAFVKDSGANWEGGGSASTLQLNNRSITLREYDLDAKSTFLVNDTLAIFQGVSYPYAIPYLRINDGFTYIVLPQTVFFNSTDETNYLTLLNGTVAPANDQQGTYTLVGQLFSYVNAVGENYNFTNTPVLSTYLAVDISITAVSTAFQFNYSGGLNVIDWGDSTNVMVNTAPAITFTLAHTYAAISTPTIRIFTDNTMDGLNLNFHATHAFITNVDGTTNLSSGLTFFTLDSTDLSALTSIDPSFLNNCQANIKTVAFTNTRIKAFSPDVFVSSLNPALVTAYFGNNQLSVSNVDDLLNQIYGAVWGIGSTSGAIDVRQTPTAPPTSASATARANLISAGWTIFHD